MTLSCNATTIHHMQSEEKKEFFLQPSHLSAYRYIESYTKKNLYAPDLEDIAKGVELSVRQTYRIIDELCDAGYLSRLPYRRRTIKITKKI